MSPGAIPEGSAGIIVVVLEAAAPAATYDTLDAEAGNVTADAFTDHSVRLRMSALSRALTLKVYKVPEVKPVAV